MTEQKIRDALSKTLRDLWTRHFNDEPEVIIETESGRIKLHGVSAHQVVHNERNQASLTVRFDRSEIL